MSKKIIKPTTAERIENLKDQVIRVIERNHLENRSHRVSVDRQLEKMMVLYERLVAWDEYISLPLWRRIITRRPKK